MVTGFSIGSRKVGPAEPCYIIAEAGVNHNGDLGLARQLVTVAARAGADAVKFQTFKANQLATLQAPKARYQQAATDENESQYEMLKKLELHREGHHLLAQQCAADHITFLSTPFDEGSTDVLAEMGVPVFKIPSGELTNLPFLKYTAAYGKPMIVSTGMAELPEIAAAVDTIRNTGNEDILLLHCVSSYPAAPEDVNLRAMATMRREFSLPVGFSDHTMGIEVALAAVSLGACVIEKHFTINVNLPGPDHKASLEPGDLTALIKGIRTVESAFGDGIKRPTGSEIDTRAVARKSLVAARDLAAGTVLTKDMIAIKRPGTGMPPSQRAELVGMTLKAAVRAGTLLSTEILACEK